MMDRPWSCYPQGVMPTRRVFLRTLAAAAAAAGASLHSVALGQEVAPGGEAVPSFPPGGLPEGSVQLNYNENPLGPSKKAISAILEEGLGDANRYNDIDPLTDAIADHHGVPAKNVLVGCGSTEFLQFAPWAFLKDGGNIVLPEPSYGWSAGVAASMGREVVRVPLGKLGVVDMAAIKKSVNRNTRIVYLANPNNPTGAAIPIEQIVSLVGALPSGAVLMVDEAYHEFLPDGGNALDLVRRQAPVLVLRTFSKSYGMAGLRLGFAIGPDAVLEKVKTVWWSDFGINTAARIAGPAALADTEHVRRYLEIVDMGLEQLRSGLEALGVRPYPHRAPFLMADFGRSTDQLVRGLRERRIFVQPGSNWKKPTFMRISVGAAGDNQKFLSAVEDLFV